MKPLYILLPFMLVINATSTWGQSVIQIEETQATFDVEIDCDGGTARIGLIEPETGTYLEIGALDRRSADAEPTTALLRSDTRSAIGRAVLARAGLLEAEIDEPLDVASCLGFGRPAPTVRDSSCHNGTCVCYEDENTNCSWFAAACKATGGTSGHNICTW